VKHLTAQIDALGQQQETYHRDCTRHQARTHDAPIGSARRATPLWLRPCYTLCRRATPSCAPSYSGCRRTTPCWRTGWRASKRRRATRRGGPLGSSMPAYHGYTPSAWPHTRSSSILLTGARLGAGAGAPRDGARARDGARLQPRLRYRVALLLLPAQPRAELHLRHTCDDLAAAAHPALLTRPPPPRELIGRARREV
jgi:hypothetical protein